MEELKMTIKKRSWVPKVKPAGFISSSKGKSAVKAAKKIASSKSPLKTAVELMAPVAVAELLRMASKLPAKTITTIGVGKSNVPEGRREVRPAGSYGSMSHSHFLYKLHESRPYPASTLKYSFRANRSFNLGADQNKQGFEEVSCLFSNWGSTPLANGGSYPVYSIEDQVFAALYSPTASAGAGPVPTRETSKVDIKRLDVVTTLVNDCNIPIYLDVYELVPKHDVAHRDLSPRIGRVAGAYSPLWCVAVGLDKTPGGSLTSFEELEVKPTASLMFNTFWKCVHQTSLEMLPGSTHKHTSVYELNLLLNNMRVSVTDGVLAGASPVFLFVTRGSPVASRTDASVVGVGASRALVTQEFLLHAVSPAISSEIIIENYSRPPVPEAQVVGPPLVEELSGEQPVSSLPPIMGMARKAVDYDITLSREWREYGWPEAILEACRKQCMVPFIAGSNLSPIERRDQMIALEYFWYEQKDPRALSKERLPQLPPRVNGLTNDEGV